MRTLVANCLLVAGLALVLNLTGLKFLATYPSSSATVKPEHDKEKTQYVRGEDSQVPNLSIGKDRGPQNNKPEEIVGKLSTGGAIGPDAKTEVACDLPNDFLFHNTGGQDGAGLCVFASITYAAFYQNESRLIGLFDAMKKERGGGWPEKVDRMIAKHGAGASYFQYEGSDPGILKAALASGRMPCVTYNGHEFHRSKRFGLDEYQRVFGPMERRRRRLGSGASSAAATAATKELAGYKLGIPERGQPCKLSFLLACSAFAKQAIFPSSAAGTAIIVIWSDPMITPSAGDFFAFGG